METVLVTGGAGFIGSHTCKALASHGFLPVAFDDLSWPCRFRALGPLVNGDILDLAALDAAFERHRPGAVIHFAALAYVGESMSRPLAYYRINVAGLVNVLEAMLRHGTPTIVLSSSCPTYGIPSELPIVESAPQRPINPYGRSKLAGEQILADARTAEGLRVAMLRYWAPSTDLRNRLSDCGRNMRTRLRPRQRSCRRTRRGASAARCKQPFAHTQSQHGKINFHPQYHQSNGTRHRSCRPSRSCSAPHRRSSSSRRRPPLACAC
jgi:UDP-glucose 4-epimerase